MNTTFTRLLACGVLATGACFYQPHAAHAAVIDVNFQGTEQSFTAEVSGGGNLFADGKGVGPNKRGNGIQAFVFTEPLNHPLALLNDLSDFGGTPGVSAETDPRSVALPKIDAPYRDAGGTKFVFYDPSTGDGTPGSGDPVGNPFELDQGKTPTPPKVFSFSQTQLTANGQAISNIQNLDLDISHGVTTDFALSKVVITSTSPNVLLKAISIDVKGTLKDLVFEQTGGATLTPTGAGTGTFSVLGTLTAVAGNLKAIAFGVLPIDVSDQTFSQPFAMTGTYKITGNPNDPNAKIELDGSNNFSINLATITSLATELPSDELVALTISAAIDLAASINFNVGFHLERVGVIPEPGSIVLLGIGVVSIVPVWMNRRRKQRQG